MELKMRRPPNGNMQVTLYIDNQAFIGNGETMEDALFSLCESLDYWGYTEVSDYILKRLCGYQGVQIHPRYVVPDKSVKKILNTL